MIIFPSSNKLFLPGDFLPTKKPPAYRAIYHATSGETIHLKCPDAYPYLPVAWQFEEKTLYANVEPLLRHQFQGELSSDNIKFEVNDEISIKRIKVQTNILLKIILLNDCFKVSSSGYYSCYVNSSLSATYSIFVRKHFI